MAAHKSRTKLVATTAGRFGLLFYVCAVSCLCMPTVNGQVIAKLLLINTATQQTVLELTNGVVVDLWARGLTNANTLSVLAVPATTGGSTVASVRFLVDVTAYAREENSAPFALCGDVSAKLTSCSVLATTGVHTVTATPYSGTNGKGTVGAVKQATFTIVSGNITAPIVATPKTAPVTTPVLVPVAVTTPVAAPVKSPVMAPFAAPIATPVGTPVMIPSSTSIIAFYLIDVPNNRRLKALSDGEVVSLRDLNVAQASFNIEVETGSSVASVLFLENGNKESSKPLSYCGDTNGIFATCSNLVVGTRVHTVTVRPYTGSKQTGTQLPDVAISFSIQVEPAVASPPLAAAAPLNTPVAAPVSTPMAAPMVAPVAVAPTAPFVVPPITAPVTSPVMTPLSAPIATPVMMPSIMAFYLIDASNNRRLKALSNGEVVSLRDLNLTQASFNIEVESSSSVASIRFLETDRNENARPFTYCGKDINVACASLVAGTHTITVRPYTGRLQSGTPLPDVAITFSIQRESVIPVPPVAPPVLPPSVPTPMEPVIVTLFNAGPNKTFPILDAASLTAMYAKESPFGIWYWAAYKPNKAHKGIYPGMKGGSILCRWSELEPVRGVYDWSQVHAEMDAAIAAGLRYSFTLMVGPDAPEWIYQQGVPKVLTTETGWQFPYYFDSLYRQWFDTLVQEVVAHLKNLTLERANALVEVRLNEGSTGDPSGYKGDVLSDYAQYDISDAEWDAFRRMHIQAVRNYIGDDGLSKIDMSFTHVSDEIEAFAASLFPNAQFFKNGMASHGYHIPEDESSVLNVQRSQAFDGDPKFGGTRLRWFGELDDEWFNGWFQKSPVESFWWSAIYALHMGLSRWLVDGDAMQVPAHHFALDFFNKHGEYIDAATSPYAFCALRDGLDASDTTRFRESQYGTIDDDERLRLVNILDDFQDHGAVVEDYNVTGAGPMAFRGRTGYVDVLYGGVRGNYHRFLYQVDPPAESIGWWHVGSNDWPYGRFARSFHSSSGRTAMYFRLDDRFISDKQAPQAVTVSVTYYDEGNGTWEVMYKDFFLGVQSAVTIRCGGTPTWKKVQLDLAHAELNGRLDKGADFMLRHVSGSDTKFHMIELDRA